MTTEPGAGRRGRPAALHVVAALTLLTFGCTTVRAPVSGIAATVPVHGLAAEPQVELWLESAREVTPDESAAATAQARAALHHALEGRKLGEDDVLVVRAQAVSRTRSHRNDQRAAVAGIVVGAVAIVAVVVLAVASGKGGGSGPSLRGAAKAGGVAGRGVAPAIPVPAPGRPGVPRVPAPRVTRAPSGPGGASVHVDVGVVTEVPYEPAAEAQAGAVETAAYAPPPPLAAREPAPPERISAVTLPPPEPLRLDGRSFFDGDWLRLELMVVDAGTGEVRWVKTVADDVDVRDGRKVRAAIDRALAQAEGWYSPTAGAYERVVERPGGVR